MGRARLHSQAIGRMGGGGGRTPRRRAGPKLHFSGQSASGVTADAAKPATVADDAETRMRGVDAPLGPDGGDGINSCLLAQHAQRGFPVPLTRHARHATRCLHEGRGANAERHVHACTRTRRAVHTPM
jgi:hypothetical protein